MLQNLSSAAVMIGVLRIRLTTCNVSEAQRPSLQHLPNFPNFQCKLFTLYLLCHLLTTFANSLDQGQARQNVGPDLDPNCLTLIVFLKEFFKKVDFEKKQQQTKKKWRKFPGNFPMEEHLEYINTNYLQHFDKIDPNTSVPSQKRWQSPVTVASFCNSDF